MMKETGNEEKKPPGFTTCMACEQKNPRVLATIMEEKQGLVDGTQKCGEFHPECLKAWASHRNYRIWTPGYLRDAKMTISYLYRSTVDLEAARRDAKRIKRGLKYDFWDEDLMGAAVRDDGEKKPTSKKQKKLQKREDERAGAKKHSPKKEWQRG